jgi:hypothetical protein
VEKEPPFLMSQKGSMATTPSGSIENASVQKANGFNWIACNTPDDHPPSAWGPQRSDAASAGQYAIPWDRCYSLNEVSSLLEVAKDWNALACIINLEQDTQGHMPDPEQVIQRIDASGYKGEIAISTVAWLYNSRDWTVFGNRYYPVFPQIFPQENDSSKAMWACIQHAVNLGFQYVYPTYGAHWGKNPDSFDMSIPHNVYPSNDIGDWSRW